MTIRDHARLRIAKAAKWLIFRLPRGVHMPNSRTARFALWLNRVHTWGTMP